MKRTATPARLPRSGAAARLTYVYCLVRSEAPPRTAAAPRGLVGGGRPRALRAGTRLWLIVSRVPRSRYDETAIDTGLRDVGWVGACALAHETVVEHFCRYPAVVPMKLFTLFESDERALLSVRQRERQIEKTLDRVAGCLEWTVRVERRGPAPPGAGPSRAPRSGKAFLQARQRARASTRRLAARDRTVAGEALAGLERWARASVAREPAPAVEAGVAPVGEAIFLVAADGRRFRDAVERLSRRLARQGCAVTLTGPWPPYHFAGSPE